VKRVKYLGVTLDVDPKITIAQAKSSITKYLGFIKGKLRYASLSIKEKLMQAYIRSLLIYFTTPLVASGLIKPDTIESWEREHYRKLHLLPCDVKRDFVVNLVRNTEPTS
jgi:hypothetical protein